MPTLADPNGSATTYQFEWGTTAAYGSKVPVTAKPVGSETGAVAVSATLIGLSPDTEYHFRIVATNAHGTVKGADETFVSANAPEGDGPTSQPMSALKEQNSVRSSTRSRSRYHLRLRSTV